MSKEIRSPQIILNPIGHIRCSRKQPQDDNWNAESTTLELDPEIFSSESLVGLSEFSHIEVVFFMDGVTELDKQYGSRHPRGDSKYPLTGVFAQRGRNRPNPIGLAVCRIKSIDGLSIAIQDCDAIDGTPVLDIKPYVTAFGPKSKVTEPRWILDLMNDYWEKDKAQSTDPALEVMIKNAIKERELENKDKALDILEQARQRFPESPLVPYQIGWTHDALGKEADAVGPYKQAIALGLHGKERHQLFIALSSTLRSLGRYPEALAVIDQACAEAPHERVTKVFRSLVLNNLDKGDEAIGALLNVLLDSTTDCEVRAYARALEYYSTRLREVFE
jgi:tRNA-Thr(GGU) m(6)t(6)A37 methyltransferase TsaA